MMLFQLITVHRKHEVQNSHDLSSHEKNNQLHAFDSKLGMHVSVDAHTSYLILYTSSECC